MQYSIAALNAIKESETKYYKIRQQQTISGLSKYKGIEKKTVKKLDDPKVD